MLEVVSGLVQFDVAAIRHDHQKLVFRPTAQESGRAQGMFQGCGDHVQNAIGGFASVGGAKLLQVVDPNAQYPEGKVIFGEEDQMLSQVRSNQPLVHDAGNGIEAAVRLQVVLPVLPFRQRTLFLEALRDGNHSALLSSNGHRPNLHRNPVTLFVAEEHQGVADPAFVQGRGKRDRRRRKERSAAGRNARGYFRDRNGRSHHDAGSR